jgi:hypothetical protein
MEACLASEIKGRHALWRHVLHLNQKQDLHCRRLAYKLTTYNSFKDLKQFTTKNMILLPFVTVWPWVG